MLPLWEFSQYSFPPKEVDTQENIAAINATMKSVITRESDTPTNTFWVQRQAGYL